MLGIMISTGPVFTKGEDIVELYAFGTSLGQGNYGNVRTCMELYKSGPQLACKTIPFSNFQNFTTEVNDVQREIKVMLELGPHPNLVELKGVHRDRTGWHIVMELCKGGELFEEVMRRQRFSEVDAADTILQVASAVEWCHSHNVVHRDIKLENILLTKPAKRHVNICRSPTHSTDCWHEQESCTTTSKDARLEGKLDVKLADFGLAAFLRRGQTLTDVAGSPFYMAPEIVKGLPYGHAADVWSLGVMLYTLLSGYLPFVGQSNEEIYEAVKKGEICLDDAPWNGVSQEAKNLVQRMLSPDPASRPTAKDILSDEWICNQSFSGSSSEPKTNSRRHVSTEAVEEQQDMTSASMQSTTPERQWRFASMFQKSPLRLNLNTVDKFTKHSRSPSEGSLDAKVDVSSERSPNSTLETSSEFGESEPNSPGKSLEESPASRRRKWSRRWKARLSTKLCVAVDAQAAKQLEHLNHLNNQATT